MTASAHARRSRALTATLALATLIVAALWGPVASKAMAKGREKADGQPSPARKAGPGPAVVDRAQRASRPDLRDSRAAGRRDRTGDGRSTRDRGAGSVSATEPRSRRRDGGSKASALRESLRARTDATRHRLREHRERLHRQVRARADTLRRRGREGAGPSSARSAPTPSGDRARPDSYEAGVSIASRERIELLPGRQHILRGNRALVRGYVPSGRSGRTVVLELLMSGRWLERDRALTGAEGKFYLAWYLSRTGRYRVRVRDVYASPDTLPSPRRLLYIYRRAVASWYGPGFYGNRTACGRTFTSRLLGVAHRSLPCGYRVTLRYRGRAITVPVVDRGPYVHGRDYDLTNATREYLDFEGVDDIWATA